MREVPVVASPLKAPFSFHGRGARGEAASRARWRCATSLIGIGASLGLAACLLAAPLWAQIPGRNVNMVSGATLPDGDPFLRQQNEPSIAASSRNPFHVFGFVNDYRTIDIPFSDEPPLRMAADSWLGIFKSYDGGQSWLSTLLPGFPQDDSPEGLASPILGFDAAADPVVRAGAHGMFYLSAIALDREEPNLGALFLARYIDLNNKEGVVFSLIDNRDPIKYVDTVLIDQGTAGIFIDKPWMAVDIPRPGAGTCTITAPEDEAGGPTITQTFPAGNIYVAYADFVGRRNNIRSRIWVRRSTDCGATWDRAVKLSEGFPINQGTTVAIDPQSGDVYVAWRRFASCDDEGNCLPHAILVSKSSDGGWTFGKSVEVRAFAPFDQPTLPNAAFPEVRGFRTNSFPTMAVDGTGRVYLAWTERGPGPEGDARVVVATSPDGLDWNNPVVAADNPQDRRGHQLMPSLSFAGGKLTLLFYDQRNDFARALGPGTFGPFILDPAEIPWGVRTIDVRVAQAEPDDLPVFTDYAAGRPSVQVSRYRFGLTAEPPCPAGLICVKQLEANPPNLPLFRDGTAPFIGDYIDLGPSPSLLPPSGDEGWRFNTSAEDAPFPVFHAIWADNRDVRLPEDGDWTKYTPPQSAFTDEPCEPEQTSSRNQNVYTSRITQGLYMVSPGNSKPVDEIQRAFVVYLQNTTAETRSFRLEILDQPPDGKASFRQFELLTILDVTIPPRSSVSRSVFVTSSEARPQVRVRATEIETVEGELVDGGLFGSVVLNPDILNPDILNPDILNPDILNPDILNAEVHNPDILNPDILNPDILNPDILNPDILNPDILNPDILNPDILNPDILNPDILNPDILNPDILNPDILNAPPEAGLTDVTWEVQNSGNTTSGYDFALFLAATPEEFQDFVFQLLVYRIQTTVDAEGCDLVERTHADLLVNILDPNLFDPAVLNGGDQASFFLAPEEKARVTLRVLDPNRFEEPTFDLETVESKLIAIVAAQAVNTEDAAAGVTEPPVALVITTTSLADGVVGTPYSQTLQAIGGTPPYEWSIFDGVLPGGLELDQATGVISGTPDVTGEFAFTVRVIDSGTPPNGSPQEGVPPQQESFRKFVLRIAEPLEITTTSLADGVVGEPYSQTLEATGGIAPYTWSEPAGMAFDPSTGAGAIGTPCEGLTLDAGGTIAGVPAAEGTCGPFTVQVQDAANPAQTATRQDLSITVLEPAPAILTVNFVQQPTDTVVGQAISPAVVVQVVDDAETPVPGAFVTIFLGHAACPQAVLVGGDAMVVTDSSGLATFPLLFLSSGGFGYTLEAEALKEGFAPAVGTSDPFDVEGFCGTVIDFETPSLGDDSQLPLPAGYTALGVTFTVEPGTFGDEVVGLVKNSATSACVPPADANQKLATGRGEQVGFSGFPIRATFGSGVTATGVSVDFHALGGSSVRLRLFNSDNQLLSSVTEIVPSQGVCEGFPGGQRGRRTVSASASEPIAYAIMDIDGSFVFTIDDFAFVQPGSGTIEWIRQFGSAATDSANALATDASGVYAVGHTLGALEGQQSAGEWDAFVRKYDSGGSELWTRQFGTNRSELTNAAAADMSGVYVAGSTSGEFEYQPNTGGLDVFLRKYDPDGIELWTRQLGTGGADLVAGLAVDPSGLYVVGVTGEFFGSAESDAFLRKFDTDGNEVWSRQFGTESFDMAQAVTVGSSGVYVVGETDGTFDGLESAGDRDAFVRKYDFDGNIVWTRQFGTSGSDLARGVAIHESGLYVAGSTQGALDGQQSAGGWDAFLVKYDLDGDVVWTRQFGTPEREDTRGVAADASGIYVTGITTGEFEGQQMAGDWQEAFLRKYDSDGNHVWTLQFGTEFEDSANAVALDDSGVYVAGGTFGALGGQQNAGDRDVFVVKLVK